MSYEVTGAGLTNEFCCCFQSAPLDAQWEWERGVRGGGKKKTASETIFA